MISKTRGWTCRPTVFVHRHSSRLMRSGKTSNKNNPSCYGHELIPVCLSSDAPSKSFSSRYSVQSHPGHYCSNKTRTCRGVRINNCDAAEWKYHPPSSFFCLPIYAPSSYWFPPHWHILALSRSLAHRQELVNLPTHRLPSLSCHDIEIRRWRFAIFPVKIFHRFYVHGSRTKDVINGVPACFTWLNSILVAPHMFPWLILNILRSVTNVVKCFFPLKSHHFIIEAQFKISIMVEWQWV